MGDGRPYAPPGANPKEKLPRTPGTTSTARAIAAARELQPAHPPHEGTLQPLPREPTPTGDRGRHCTSGTRFREKHPRTISWFRTAYRGTAANSSPGEGRGKRRKTQTTIQRQRGERNKGRERQPRQPKQPESDRVQEVPGRNANVARGMEGGDDRRLREGERKPA